MLARSTYYTTYTIPAYYKYTAARYTYTAASYASMSAYGQFMSTTYSKYFKGYCFGGVRYNWVSAGDLDINIGSSEAWAYATASGSYTTNAYDGIGGYYQAYVWAEDNFSNGGWDSYFYVRCTIHYLTAMNYSYYRTIPAYYAYIPAYYAYIAKKVYQPMHYKYQRL